MRIEKGSDITKNVKIIEWIKNEILISVSNLFNLLFKGVKPIDNGFQNAIANIIMLSYLLGKRLGISFDEIDYKIKEKAKEGIKEEHSIETWFGDLSELEKHIDNREWYGLNKDLRLSRVLPIVILAIILILVSLNVPQLSLLLFIIPIPFALIGTLSNIKNNIISLIIALLALIFFTETTYAVDIFINSIVPGAIIGIIAKRVLSKQDSNKYEPIFAGSIVFIISIVVYYVISKYAFRVDILDELIQVFNKSIEAQKSLLQSATNYELLGTEDIIDTFRNIVPSILFFRSMILSIIIYLIEIYALKKMKYGDLGEIKFRNFYLPGNAIAISFVLYLLMLGLSYMKTPLYTDAIFLNLQIVFNFMFIIQGISVSIYFIKKWLKNGVGKKVFIGAMCVGIFGMTGISFIGMIDSILDFRNVRSYKSI